MVEYIENMLDNILEDMKGESATPDAHHLFDISEDATKLSWTDTDFFHNFVAQLLHLSKISRPEIQMSV